MLFPAQQWTPQARLQVTGGDWELLGQALPFVRQGSPLQNCSRGAVRGSLGTLVQLGEGGMLHMQHVGSAEGVQGAGVGPQAPGRGEGTGQGGAMVQPAPLSLWLVGPEPHASCRARSGSSTCSCCSPAWSDPARGLLEAEVHGRLNIDSAVTSPMCLSFQDTSDRTEGAAQKRHNVNRLKFFSSPCMKGPPQHWDCFAIASITVLFASLSDAVVTGSKPRSSCPIFVFSLIHRLNPPFLCLATPKKTHLPHFPRAFFFSCCLDIIAGGLPLFLLLMLLTTSSPASRVSLLGQLNVCDCLLFSPFLI